MEWQTAKRKLCKIVLAVSAVSIATTAFASDSMKKREVLRENLVGFAIGSGNLALELEILNYAVLAATPVKSGGNLHAVRSGRIDKPMLTITGDFPVTIKFDLYLSQDGEKFVYTSSCALTPGISSFEAWEQPVLEFALGNPRVIQDSQAVCE